MIAVPRRPGAADADNGGDVTAIPFPVRMYVDYVRVYQNIK